jgi:predicted ATPase/DNA-binding SARP family transcriptional activator
MPMGSEYRILGELEALQDRVLVELGSPRLRALLARLLINRGHPVTADRLVEDLWKDVPPDTARHTLHVYLSRLRKALGEDAARLEHTGTGYRFSIEPTELDAARFEQLAADGRAALARNDAETAATELSKALALWRGPTLAEFADQPFARDEATRLDELKLATLEQRIWADLDLGHHGQITEELQDLTIQHPFRETFWEQLMLALYRCGRQTDALRAYQAVRANLAEELGIDPGPALQRMEDRILSQDPNLDPTDRATSGGPPGGMPVQRTSFIGREKELNLAGELLARCRLLTFTGPPGSGKTRLALRLATETVDDFPHGSFFVPLSAVADPKLVARTMAGVLGLSKVQDETLLDGIKAFLSERRLLLVLDNFEQILPAAPVVGQLLDAAPGLKVVVTSRSPLGLSGEQEFPVPPLRVPSLEDLPAIEELSGFDAVALFVARSRAVDPKFSLTAEAAATVAAITVRLDGLPLALELAAARMRLLTPVDLLARLEKRLTLLTRSPTDTADRHKTMRDAIAWSYELLEPSEQRLFRHLGVFTAGFTLEAAGAVTDLPESEVLDGIDSLLSRSLLYRPVDVGQARFGMLAMIREFASEELDKAGEYRQVGDRHAGFFLDLAETIEPQLTRDPGGSGSLQLASEIDNLRTALQFADETDQPDLGLKLANCIWRFWQSSNRLLEGRAWINKLLDHPAVSAEARAKGLTALAGLAYWQSDYQAAMESYSQALDIFQAAGDRYNEADTLYGMSLTANWAGDLSHGRQLAEEARSKFEDLGSSEGVGRALLAEAFALWKNKELEAAKETWETALAIIRDCGDQALANTALVGLASLTFQLGDRAEAMEIVLEGVEEASLSHNDHVTVWMLDFVAAFAAPALPEEAVRLAGAVDAMRREAGGGILPASLDIEDARSVATRVLDPAALRRAWALGQTMTLEQSVDRAYELGRLVSPVAR